MTLKEKKRDLMRYRMLMARARGALDAGDVVMAAELSDCAEVFRQELIDRFALIEDRRVRQILQLRYLQGLSWEKIAERMYFTQRWVLRLHKRGVEEL